MKLYQLLVESRVDYLKDWFVKEWEKIKPDSLTSYVRLVFLKIRDIDPTNNKIYLQWFLTKVLQDIKKLHYSTESHQYISRLEEDAYKWKEYLTIYHKIKNRLPLEQRDINKLSLDQLKNIALEFKENEEEIGTKNEVLNKKYKINEDENYLVYMFKTATQDDFKMYQLVSTNTEWCTRPDYDTFKEYINQSPLFVFINKNNRINKFQYHQTTNQFMDRHDIEVSMTIIIDLVKLISNYLPDDIVIGGTIQGKQYIINKNGKFIARNLISSLILDDLEYIAVQFANHDWGIIDKKGKVIFKSSEIGYIAPTYFGNGFHKKVFHFRNNNHRWALGDINGNILGDGFIFKAIYSFSPGGIAKVEFPGGEQGFINLKGEVIARGFRIVLSFEGDETTSVFPFFKNNKLTGLNLYLTTKGQLVTKDYGLFIPVNTFYLQDILEKKIVIYPEKFP